MNTLLKNGINLCYLDDSYSKIKANIEDNTIIYIYENILLNYPFWYNIFSNKFTEVEICILKNERTILPNIKKEHMVIKLYTKSIRSITAEIKIKKNLLSKENKYNVLVIDDDKTILGNLSTLTEHCKNLYLIKLKKRTPKICKGNQKSIIIYLDFNKTLSTENRELFEHLMRSGKFGEACTLKKEMNTIMKSLIMKAEKLEIPIYVTIKHESEKENIFNILKNYDNIKNISIQKNHVIKKYIEQCKKLDTVIFIDDINSIKDQLENGDIQQIHLISK